MKKIRLLVPILAFIIAITGSAFQNFSDKVWFEVDPVSGDALNPTSGGLQGDVPAQNCMGNDDFCATALSISQNEVIDNLDGTYGIATGVDITSSSYYEEQRKEN